MSPDDAGLLEEDLEELHDVAGEISSAIGPRELHELLLHLL